MRTASVLLLATAATADPVERATRPKHEHVFKYNDPEAAKCKSTPDCEEGSLW